MSIHEIDSAKFNTPSSIGGLPLGPVHDETAAATARFWPERSRHSVAAIKLLNRLHRKEDAKPAAPPRQEVLLDEIRDLLKRR